MPIGCEFEHRCRSLAPVWSSCCCSGLRRETSQKAGGIEGAPTTHRIYICTQKKSRMRFRIVFVRRPSSSCGLSYIPTKTNNAEQGTSRAHMWACGPISGPGSWDRGHTRAGRIRPPFPLQSCLYWPGDGRGLVTGLRRYPPQETDLLGTSPLGPWVPLGGRPRGLGYRLGPLGAPPVAGGGIYCFFCIFEHCGGPGRPNGRGPLFFKPPPCGSRDPPDRSLKRVETARTAIGVPLTRYRQTLAPNRQKIAGIGLTDPRLPVRAV
jgi:hypothetical protein